jgi:hypothetical protein
MTADDREPLSKWQLERYRKPHYEVLDPASQAHPTGLRGSRTEHAPGTRERESAMLELQGGRSRLPNLDHLLVGLWVKGQLPFERVREQLTQPIGVLGTAAVVSDCLKTKSADDFVDEFALQASGSNAGRRNALMGRIRRRLDRQEGVFQSVLTVFAQVAIGVRPIWNDSSEPPLQESVIKAL